MAAWNPKESPAASDRTLLPAIKIGIHGKIGFNAPLRNLKGYCQRALPLGWDGAVNIVFDFGLGGRAEK